MSRLSAPYVLKPGRKMDFMVGSERMLRAHHKNGVFFKSLENKKVDFDARCHKNLSKIQQNIYDVYFNEYVPLKEQATKTKFFTRHAEKQPPKYRKLVHTKVTEEKFKLPEIKTRGCPTHDKHKQRISDCFIETLREKEALRKRERKQSMMTSRMGGEIRNGTMVSKCSVWQDACSDFSESPDIDDYRLKILKAAIALTSQPPTPPVCTRRSTRLRRSFLLTLRRTSKVVWENDLLKRVGPPSLARKMESHRDSYNFNNRDFTSNRDFTRDSNRDLTMDNNRDFNRDNNRDSNRDLTRDSNRDSTRDSNRDKTRDSNRDLTWDSNRHLTRDSNRDITRDINRDLTRDSNSNRDFTSDSNRYFTRDSNRDFNRESHKGIIRNSTVIESEENDASSPSAICSVLKWRPSIFKNRILNDDKETEEDLVFQFSDAQSRESFVSMLSEAIGKNPRKSTLVDPPDHNIEDDLYNPESSPDIFSVISERTGSSYSDYSYTSGSSSYYGSEIEDGYH